MQGNWHLHQCVSSNLLSAEENFPNIRSGRQRWTLIGVATKIKLLAPIRLMQSLKIHVIAKNSINIRKVS